MRLSREQAAALRERIGPWVNYTVRVRERMTKVGFPLADPLYVSVMKTEDAIRELWIKLHYMSCAGGVGEPRDERPNWKAPRRGCRVGDAHALDFAFG